MTIRAALLVLLPTLAGAEPLHLMFPAPDLYVPACHVVPSGDTIPVHVTVEGSLSRIEMLEPRGAALPSWQVTPLGVPGSVTLTGEGGNTAMDIAPALPGPQVAFDSALAAGPGLDGPATYSFQARDASGAFIPGLVVIITRDAGDCPGG